MANWSDLTFTSGQLDYIAMLNTLRSRSQDVATDVESARGGAASLGAAVLRYVGATADVPMAGYRITGLPAPVDAAEPATKAYAEGLAFSSALPSVAGRAYGDTVIADGLGSSQWDENAAGKMYSFQNFGGL